MRSKKSKGFTRTMGARVMAAVGLSVAAAAILIAARPASEPADMPLVEAQPLDVSLDVPVVEPAAKAPEARAQVKMTAASKAPSVGSTSPAKTPMREVPASKPSVAASAATTLVQEPGVVTITGCLERDDETFRLKDTTGVDAPKSRSWKSGFLKKGSASIALVDAADRQNLRNHLGQRVSVTGMLVEREMRVRSLQRIAESCN